MPVKPCDEEADLNRVATYLADRGLSGERFTKTEMQTRKTPDFKVLQDGELVAYCEIKSPNDPWLDELLDEAPPLTIVGGARQDPVFNRLAGLLSKADAQFVAVNSDRAKLNILAYVNYDDSSSHGDLEETLTGYFNASDGTKHPTMMHVAEGRIAEAKRRIDAYVWFYGHNRRKPVALINPEDAERKKRICALLHIDPKAIG